MLIYLFFQNKPLNKPIHNQLLMTFVIEKSAFIDEKG